MVDNIRVKKNIKDVREAPTGNQVKRPLKVFIHLIVWLTGVLVSLAVGFGMISGTLTIPYIEMVVPYFGWVVVVLTLLSVILVISDKFRE